MPLTSAQKNKRRKEAQAKLGRIRKCDFFTNEEWIAVQAFIERLRADGKGEVTVELSAY